MLKCVTINPHSYTEELSWEELKEKAKELGAEVYTDLIVFKGFWFWSDGRIEYGEEMVSLKRTPEQMLMIMEALK